MNTMRVQPMKLGPVIDVRLVRQQSVTVEGQQIVAGARAVPGALADLLLAFGQKMAPEEPDPCPDGLVFEP